MLKPITPCIVQSLCHVWTKGPLACLYKEVETATIGVSCCCAYGIQEKVMNAIIRHILSRMEIKPYRLSYLEVVQSKAGNTSVGYPWKRHYTDYITLLTEKYVVDDDQTIDHQMLANCCYELEALIETDQAYTGIFYVFGKLDKYSFRKVQQQQYRTIQVSDMFALFILHSWWGPLIEEIERTIDQLYLQTNPLDYKKKYLERMSFTGWSIGIDYSRYDKSVTSDCLLMTFRIMQSIFPMPQKMYDWVVLTVVSPIMLMQDNESTLYTLYGSNPSGQFCTSISNSLIHIAHNCVLASEIFDATYEEYLTDRVFKSIMTGDDGRDAFFSLSDARKAISEFPGALKTWFGIDSKIDAVDVDGKKEPYKAPSSAPYLSLTEFYWKNGTGDLWNCVRYPAVFSRMLVHINYFSSNELADYDRISDERMQGVLASSCGFEYILTKFSKSLQEVLIPKQYMEFREEAIQRGIPFPKFETIIDNNLFQFVPDSSVTQETGLGIR